MGRAERRHHNERVKAKFKRRERIHPYWTSDGEADDHGAGIYANHGCSCSCWMCGNPRRHRGEKTIQERKAILKENDNEFGS